LPAIPTSWEKYWVLCIAHLPPISLKKQATTNKKTKKQKNKKTKKQTDGTNGSGHTDPTIWLSADKTAGSDFEQPE